MSFNFNIYILHIEIKLRTIKTLIFWIASLYFWNNYQNLKYDYCVVKIKDGRYIKH